MARVNKKHLFVAYLCCLVWLCDTAWAREAAEVEDEPAGIKIISLRNAQARQILVVVDSIFGGSGETVRFAADERTNTVVVKAQPDVLKAVEAVLEYLDQASTPSPKRVAQPKIKAKSKRAQPRKVIKIRSEIRGTAAIRSLAAEGKEVKEGDLLVELDATELIAGVAVLGIEVDVLKAEIQLGAQQREPIANLHPLEDALKTAQLRRKQFEAESKFEVLVAESEITVAAATLKFAERQQALIKQRVESGQSSFGEDIAAERDLVEAKTAYELARAKKTMLLEHTRPLRLAELDLEIQLEEWNLEQARRKADLQRAQSLKKLQVLERQLQHKSDELARLKDEIDNGKIFAPVDGTVRYASTPAKEGAVRPSEGAMVRFGQLLLLLEIGGKGALK